jgi:hypothetical protein
MKNSEIKRVVYNNVYQNTSNGYVLTPSELAFEMISTLPDSVFKSDSTTFLDPICKSGTFLFEIVEKLYDEGHSISNIQSRIYTIDSNSHSLNVANSYIKKILNKESGCFKIDFKYDFVEKYFNRLVNVTTSGKYSTFEEFISIIILDKKENYLMVELKNSISNFIAKYEKVSKLESKLFGEVFTPRQLIDEMLDTLPKSTWSNPDIKWLDPAVGIGNFPAAILDRLMVGLESIITNEDDRRKHILEEMLYMCDISSKNLFLLYMLFDKNNEFKLNVYRGSFLTEDFDKHMKEVWVLDGFDVVVGNPPYQETHEDGRSTRSSVRLWAKFILNIFDKNILKNNGYLTFVTPSGWAGSSSVIFDKLKDYKLLNADFSSSVSKSFGSVGGTMIFTTFLIQKKKEKTNTKIKFDQGIANLDIFSFPITPIKSTNIYDFTILSKMINSGIGGLEWRRNDDKNKKIDGLSIIMSRSKSENFDVDFSHNLDDRSGFWLYGEENYLKTIINNINLPIYKKFRWVVRSGMAIANNIKFLPVPDVELTPDTFCKMFNLDEKETQYVMSLEKTIKD